MRRKDWQPLVLYLKFSPCFVSVFFGLVLTCLKTSFFRNEREMIVQPAQGCR